MKSAVIRACLGLLIAVSQLSAQPGINWERFKTTGFENEENGISFCSALVANPDGEVTAFGAMFNPNQPRGGYPVMYRYTTRGALMDSMVFSGDSPYYGFNSAILAQDGNIIVAGNAIISDSLGQWGFRRPGFVMKINSEDLSILWVREYGEDSLNNTYQFENLICSDGGILAVGYKIAAGGNEPWVVKTDSDGNLVWQKVFSRDRHFGENIAGEVALLPDDRIVFSATIEDVAYLIWLSSDGDSLTSIEVNEISGKCVGLFVQNDTLWDVTSRSVVKYSFEGEELQIHHYDNWLPAHVYGFQQAVDAIPVEGGGCVVTGFTNYELEFDPYYYRSVTVRIDAQLRERWRVYRDTGGHYYEEKGMTVAQCEDYGICIGGTMGRAFWVAKTARDPNEVANDPEFIQPNQFLIESVYPNPFNTSTTIRFTIPLQSILGISLLDFTGREVSETGYSILIGNDQISLDCFGLSAGTYILRVQFPNRMETTSLILAK